MFYHILSQIYSEPPGCFRVSRAQLSLLFALAEQIKFYVLVFEAILNWKFEINIKCMYDKIVMS